MKCAAHVRAQCGRLSNIQSSVIATSLWSNWPVCCVVGLGLGQGWRWSLEVEVRFRIGVKIRAIDFRGNSESPSRKQVHFSWLSWPIVIQVHLITFTFEWATHLNKFHNHHFFIGHRATSHVIELSFIVLWFNVLWVPREYMNLVFRFKRHDSCSLCLLNLIKKDFYDGKQPVYLPVTLLLDHMVMAGGADS